MIRKISYILIFLLALMTLKQVYSLEVPYLSGRINDLAGILSEESKRGMEQEVKDFETKTSNQIAVLTIPSLEGENLEDFSLKVVETWKLGQKGKDNGVLLLISKNDRKLRIEVGYGLEGALTDALSSRIINDEITPNFRNGNYDKGISAGLKAIMGSIQGEYKPSKISKSPFKKLEGLLAFLFISTFVGLSATGWIKWAIYPLMIPFWAFFAFMFKNPVSYLIIFAYILLYPLFSIFSKKFLPILSSHPGGFLGGGFGGFSGGGSSFSGGGGSFGGGGSSGSW